MCGIAGILFPNGQRSLSKEEFHSRLVEMADAMEHRGPDGDGVWVAENARVGFSHRRLAIIDLSTDAAQPMRNQDGTVWVTFNGEIYNHLALRRELELEGYTFSTDHSDTEVLVHGFLAWGVEKLVKRLDGMFAFAIWDVRNQRLWFARDRIGIKPLYFTRIGGVYRFASEIKAILTDSSIPREVNSHALNHYLSFMVTPAPMTLFKGIYKLPAGHIMEVGIDGKAYASRFWSAVPNKSPLADFESLNEEALISGIRERLQSSVEKRMLSDVPFGVFLSGGIDSSANVAFMSEISNHPIETFTVGFKDYTHLNELDYARQVADKFSSNHHEVLIDSTDMQGYLTELVHQQDEPIADWVCVPLYFVSKLAKDNGIKVVQVGEGADEQFCGYESWITYLKFYHNFWKPYTNIAPTSLRRLIASVAQKWAPSTRGIRAQAAEALVRSARGQELFWSGANAFWNVHKEQVLDNFIPESDLSDVADMGFEICGLDSIDSGDIVGGYLDSFDKEYPESDFLTRMIHSEFRLRLPELLLMRVDKITMSTSVEGRVPFLDHALVEYTMGIPMTEKIRSGEKKHVLKSAVNGLIPKEIIERPKMGFSAPVADWLRDDFGAEAERKVLNSPLLNGGSLNKSYIKKLFTEHRVYGADHALQLWTLHNLTAWYDHWIA
ncbi:MAG: asparagine synthase (glutamine-hydrolyzing) [Magnetovibrio sp.]|nr:asparagine synthase (glutamine-hydrolyzing) [Magnetovibrio sp.]